jgi:hypothetical protein
VHRSRSPRGSHPPSRTRHDAASKFANAIDSPKFRASKSRARPPVGRERETSLRR